MRRRDFLLSVIAATFASDCGSAPTGPAPIVQPPPPLPPPPPPPRVPRLAVTRLLTFGDSLTEGSTAPTRTLRALTPGLTEGYPFKLHTLMSARYTEQTVTVLNAGLGGMWAAQDRDRFKQTVRDEKPELVLLWHGANDMLGLRGASEPDLVEGIAEAYGAMEDFAGYALDRGARVIIATQTPVIQGLPRGVAFSYLPRYNVRLRDLAAHLKVPLVDLYTLVPDSLVGQDGLHLTEAGYARVAEVFLQAIEKNYEMPATAAAR
jgi:acyl-CoA thioesterase-1